MLTIVILGLNHKTAPVELRERLAFSQDDTAVALEALQKYPAISEVLLLSTCNRVEVLMTTGNTSEAVENVKAYLSESKNAPIAQFKEAFYVKEGDEAVRHIFRVASSLDSMMVGEPQILGQVKEAYHTASVKQTAGVILNKLLHRTFFVSKRIRSETGIGDHAVSISYAAIELGRKIFGSLEGKQALLIGAGEMAELVVEHLIRNKVQDIIVANRTFERGVELANQFNGQAVRFEEIGDVLKRADIIISSTGSPDFIIKRAQLKGLIRSRRNRPIFFIDIAVPRDIDPEINHLSNSYVYDIDDLKGVIEENIEDRSREAVKGERIVDEAVIRFRQWYESLDVIPTIVELRNKMQGIAKNEIKKTMRSLHHLSDDDGRAMHTMTEALINKILHDPTLFLKNAGAHADKSVCLDITRKLFNLDI